MRPILTSELVNGAVGDVAPLIDFKFVRRALFFDLGEADCRALFRSTLRRGIWIANSRCAQFETAFQGCTWALH
jgi:hypothetical protein